MYVRVLGCSGSIARDNRTTSFLIDRHVLIDAGTGVGDLGLDEMLAIDHIVLSHSHLDHVLSIPLLADSVLKRRMARGPGFRPIQVHGLPATLEALARHVFNDVIWPDFTRLPTRERPILSLNPIEIGQHLDLDGTQVEILPASHTVPACGVAIACDSGWWVYTGDTGPNPALWEALRGRRIAQLVIETAFGDEDRALAEVSRHLCPSLLCSELLALPDIPPIAITHIKPGEMPAVLAQLAHLASVPDLHALQRGEQFQF
jgi:ribonuclease BN (tRNA processing enzyme)